jgi:hypothetical protein
MVGKNDGYPSLGGGDSKDEALRVLLARGTPLVVSCPARTDIDQELRR